MKAHELFDLMAKANEFKRMIGELQFRITIFVDENAIGTALSYNKFKEILGGTFHDDAVTAILTSEVKECLCNRVFKIVYTFDGEKREVKLFVE